VHREVVHGFYGRTVLRNEFRRDEHGRFVNEGLGRRRVEEVTHHRVEVARFQERRPAVRPEKPAVSQIAARGGTPATEARGRTPATTARRETPATAARGGTPPTAARGGTPATAARGGTPATAAPATPTRGPAQAQAPEPNKVFRPPTTPAKPTTPPKPMTPARPTTTPRK
jgi:hypothetical protein